MLRALLTGVCLVFFGTGAFAQSSTSIHPVPGVKNAGTYHLATRTWTRGEQPPARGTYEVLYDNTCIGLWYTALEQQTFHDDGRLPSTTSPQIDQGSFGSGTWASTSLVGTVDLYEIHQYRFAYCTGVASPMTAVQLFYDCYAACSNATLITPTAVFQISGLPGSPTPGTTVGCWMVSIDLLGSSLQFSMNADCDGLWDGTPALDNFGFAYLQETPDPSASSGPFIAGDPEGLLSNPTLGTGCCVGCDTVFWAGASVPGVNTSGSGLNTQDFFEIDDHLGGLTFAYNGCFWFGGYSTTNPPSDIFVEILGDAGSYPPPQNAYCFGTTAQGNPCPCANDNDQSDSAGAGCANGTFAAGARLWASGTPSVGADSVVLHGTRGQPNNSSMFFQAHNNLDGLGVFLDDGIQCAGGTLKRLQVKLNDAAGNANTTNVISVRSASLGDPLLAGDTRYYQWWFRDNVSPPCGLGVNDANTSNGYTITWLP